MKTFVVRLWSATDPETEAREPLHGVVEQVSSGRSTSFGSEQELLAFLRGREPGETVAMPLGDSSPSRGTG